MNRCNSEPPSKWWMCLECNSKSESRRREWISQCCRSWRNAGVLRERTVAQKSDILAPPVMEEIVVPMSQILKETVEVVLAPHERAQQRTVEQTVDVQQALLRARREQEQACRTLAMTKRPVERTPWAFSDAGFAGARALVLVVFVVTLSG